MAGLNIQYSDALLGPLAVRTMLLTNRRARLRWRFPEDCLIAGYVVLAVAFAATDASFEPWPWLFLGCTRAATSLALGQYANIRRRAGARVASPASTVQLLAAGVRYRSGP